MKARIGGRPSAGDDFCESIQHSDPMVGKRCGLAYDVNDPDPPDCPKGRRLDGDPPGRIILKKIGLVS